MQKHPITPPLIEQLDSGHGASVLSIYPKVNANLADVSLAAARGVAPTIEKPTLLVGWSSGGALAYQLAMDLSAQQSMVKGVALIDTSQRLGHASMERKLSTFGQLIAGTLQKNAVLKYPPDAGPKTIADVTRDVNKLLPDAGLKENEAKRLFDAFSANLDIFSDFEPQPLDVPTFFLAAEGRRGLAADWADAKCPMTQVEALECSHFSFFDQDWLDVTVRWLHRSVKDSESSTLPRIAVSTAAE